MGLSQHVIPEATIGLKVYEYGRIRVSRDDHVEGLAEPARVGRDLQERTRVGDEYPARV